MRLKVILGAGLVFFITLFLTFPYDTVVRYQLSKSCPNVQYSALTASWREIRLTGVQAPLDADRRVRFDQVRLSPAGIFPPLLKIEIMLGQGRAKVMIRGNRNQIRFDVNVSDFPIQEMFSASESPTPAAPTAPPSGLQLTVGFEGSGTLSLAFPLKSARLDLKGQAVMAGQNIPIDKSISLEEMGFFDDPRR